MKLKFTYEEASKIAHRMAAKAVSDGEKHSKEFAYPFAVGAMTSMITTILCGDIGYCKEFLKDEPTIKDIKDIRNS